MLKKALIVFLICALSNYFLGCYSREKVTLTGTEAKAATPEKIVSILTTSGVTYRFDKNGAQYVTGPKDSTKLIAGRLIDGTWKDLGIDSVLEVRIEREHGSAAGTVFGVIGVLALSAVLVGLIIVATKRSCPFVYSNDGSRFVFDAEPYGGAIAEGLKKTDYSRLEHLKPVNTKYSLYMNNEADETQYTDAMHLLVFDHAPGIEISPDYAGRMTAYRETRPPVTVTDEHQTNLMNFFRARDEAKWESRLPNDSRQIPADLRHHLTFTFKKDRGAQTMKFLVNAGTALWGSNMIKEMLDLRGNQVDAWYQEINAHGQEYKNLLYFMEREELYVLKLNVWENGAWTQRALINGGGPLITEDRVINVDVSHVEGDTVRIQLNPPIGYWKIDYLGVIDQEVPLAAPVEVAASFAEDHRGRDLTPMLAAVDNAYYVMPEVGDWAKLEFSVPPQASGTERSVYLKTTGYYELHLKKDRPQQTELMTELGLHPGRIVDYSLAQYLAWRAAGIGSVR
jgi:hypothetical protein